MKSLREEVSDLINNHPKKLRKLLKNAKCGHCEKPFKEKNGFTLGSMRDKDTLYVFVTCKECFNENKDENLLKEAAPDIKISYSWNGQLVQK
jgi:RNase P subunit RPR2